MENIHVVAIKQGNPVRIQSITYEQRQLSTEYMRRSIDELMSGLLCTRAYNNRQN
jgi:hypothetical protein